MTPQTIIDELSTSLEALGATIYSSSSEDHGFLCAELCERRLAVDIYNGDNGLVAQLIAGDGERIEPTDECVVVEPHRALAEASSMLGSN